MGSEAQTPFEVVRRFWAYNSDNSGWRKMEIWLKLETHKSRTHTQREWESERELRYSEIQKSKMDYGTKGKIDVEQKTVCRFNYFRIWILQTFANVINVTLTLQTSISITYSTNGQYCTPNMRVSIVVPWGIYWTHLHMWQTLSLWHHWRCSFTLLDSISEFWNYQEML